MNRTYKLYLQQKILARSKSVLFLYVILFLAIFFLYNTKSSYDKKQEEEQKKKDVLLIASTKKNSMNISKENVEKTFQTLSVVRKENKQLDRQYIIETLTFYASSSNLLNFVIDNVTEKPNLVQSSYESLSNIPNLISFEAEFSFDTIMNKEIDAFLENLSRNVNGMVVVQKIEIKRNFDTINEDTITKLNSGEKVPLLGNKVIIHWFFVKNI